MIDELELYNLVVKYPDTKDLVNAVYNKAIEDVFTKIEKELSQSSSTEYVCMNGENIHTDVGYVEDWFNEYRKK